VLHLAAATSEADVEMALTLLLEAGAPTSDRTAVQRHLRHC
jgi:hypothetical protein